MKKILLTAVTLLCVLAITACSAAEMTQGTNIKNLRTSAESFDLLSTQRTAADGFDLLSAQKTAAEGFDPLSAQNTAVGNTATGMLGDTNGDSVINALDILNVFKNIYAPGDNSLVSLMYYDVDYDGEITNSDILRIFKHIYNPDLYPLEHGTKIGQSPYIDTIAEANKLANGVQQYYSGVTAWATNNGTACIIKNQEIKLQFNRNKTTKDQYIEYLANSEGGVYLEKTMDVYIKMNNGKTYYLSNTSNHSYTNVYKHGFYYHEIRNERLNFVDNSGERIDSLQVARIFHTYSDKLHHEIQICSSDTSTTGIESIGFITEIAANKVSKIQVKDASGTHSTLEGIDWSSVEYIGFDITAAGVFGYILPVDATTGSVKVTLEGGKYIIIQERTPDNNTIEPGNDSVLNENDFYMGQRLYTDTTHDFAALEREAYIERNPLSDSNITINTEDSDNATLRGYDALRGSYIIDMNYSAEELWNKRQNLNFEANFTVQGDSYDRTIYMIIATDSGSLECAVLLDKDLISLPIPVQVSKNFAGDGDDRNKNVSSDGNVGEHNLFWYADTPYGEAIFPIVVTKNKALEYSVIHMYQNWGNFPLKQVSSIHFWIPYYHYSVGMTETNCIYYASSNIDLLPDHRGISAPYWATGIQHTSGGQHVFFRTQYTSESSSIGLNTIGRDITSYGPTYAETNMHMLSDDGKIKATYTHMEMPQTDENRTYYTMTYEFLEDTSFESFKQNTILYSVYSRDNTDEYRKFGYLNENNESVISEFKADGERYYYPLGSECPYFDLFYMPDYSGSGGTGYVNVSMLIKSCNVVINGTATSVPLVIFEKDNGIYLTLDFDKVSFSEGDTITINAIIMPWGSEDSDYSGIYYAPDQNVRDVRENTLLNPITITAGLYSEVIDNTFVPMVHTLNGSSAEFTISGGEVNQHNIKNRDNGYNVAVRAYGFTSLTAPKVYEKIDGIWVEYDISSKNTPDTLGYTNQYDGYAVYYEDDGTLSYSFVINMDEAAKRTFKITTNWDCSGFERVETEELVLYPYKSTIDPYQIGSISNRKPMFSRGTSVIDGNTPYVSLYGTDNSSTTEAWLSINQSDINASETGQYIVIKYRLPASNTEEIDRIDIFTSTEHDSAQGSDCFVINAGVEADGEWHVLVLDTQGTGYASGAGRYVKADATTGKYSLKFMRVDLFNNNGNKQTRWDISFIATHDDLQTIYNDNKDLDHITLVTGRNDSVKINPETGNVIE